MFSVENFLIWLMMLIYLRKMPFLRFACKTLCLLLYCLLYWSSVVNTLLFITINTTERIVTSRGFRVNEKIFGCLNVKNKRKS